MRACMCACVSYTGDLGLSLDEAVEGFVPAHHGVLLDNCTFCMACKKSVTGRINNNGSAVAVRAGCSYRMYEHPVTYRM